MELLKKLFEREAYIPLILIAIATVALFTGRCGFDSWASSVEVLAGVSVGSLTARKVADSIGKK